LRPRSESATYLVDPGTRTFDKRIHQIESHGGRAPSTVQDIRRVLDDKNVDVVSIATPNHWHALMTIWAAQAGKDVYVEKPCSHNIHEGRIARRPSRAPLSADRTAWNAEPVEPGMGPGRGSVGEAGQAAGLSSALLQAAWLNRHQAECHTPCRG
jgi:hypothetical protein